MIFQEKIKSIGLIGDNKEITLIVELEHNAHRFEDSEITLLKLITSDQIIV